MTREQGTGNREEVLGNFTFRYLCWFFPFTYLFKPQITFLLRAFPTSRLCAKQKPWFIGQQNPCQPILYQSTGKPSLSKVLPSCNSG
ncbi:hypothetical protein PN480_14045 [Dolichospermum circinale CS-1225]|uniref:hypothetical protein n=1 Tax=Dolichospermum circinale TaxID=109265 RepID=UPI0012DEF6E6|nr:hypothetical protein [Dolichospermum circinale]MDB9523057.1 hypothetical protein [Dolichospermum circinale CS-1225]